MMSRRQNKVAAEVSAGDTIYRCNTPSMHYSAGNNGWTASDGSTGYCDAGQACAQVL